MKKIFLALAIGLMFTSCQKDDTDIFEKSASERTTENQGEFTKYLNENNWVIDLFPNSYEDYGGYPIYLEFKDNYKVKIKSLDVLNGLDVLEDDSNYQIFNRSGSVLSFSEFNDALHFLSDPSFAFPSGPVKTVDYEFIYQNKEKDIIYTKGMKSRNNIRFVKTTKSADDYLKDVKEVMGYLGDRTAISFNVVDEKIKFEMKNSKKFFNFQYTSKEKGEKDATLHKTAFVCTDKGIRFFKPFIINGVEVFELTLDEQESVLKSVDGKVEIKLFKAPFNLNLESWYLLVNDDNASKKVKNSFEEVQDADLKQGGGELSNKIYTGMYITPGGNEFGPSFRFFSKWLQNGTTYPAEYNMTFRSFADDNGEFNIEFIKGKAGFNWKYYPYLTSMVDFMTKDSVYKVEVLEKDSSGKPIKAKLINKKNTDVWFILNKN